jgi:hypothetical protein
MSRTDGRTVPSTERIRRTLRLSQGRSHFRGLVINRKIHVKVQAK